MTQDREVSKGSFVTSAGQTGVSASSLVRRGLDLVAAMRPRIVCFPDGASIGRLSIRGSADSGEADFDRFSLREANFHEDLFSGLAEQLQGDWSSFGQAHGSVSVPARSDLKLTIRTRLPDALSKLPALGPEDLQALELPANGEINGLNGDWYRPALRHLRGLTGLLELSLDDSDVRDADLAHLRELTRLLCLDLSCISVGDAGMAHVARLAELRYLRLANTHVSDAGIDRLRDCRKLRALDLSGTQITDTAMLLLADLPEMDTLELTSTAVTDAGLLHLAGAPRLRQLDLTQYDALPGVTDRGMSYLGACSELETLLLGGLHVSDDGLAQLRGLPKLKMLDIRGAALTDAGLACLGVMKSLVALDLPGVEVSDLAVQRLTDLPQLEKLTLGAWALGDAGLAALGTIDSLKELHLYGISDSGLKHLQGLPRLEKLDLRGTAITDAGLKHMQGLRRLEKLDLRETAITDAGLATVGALRSLKRLDISGTQVGDSGMQHLQGLAGLEELQLVDTAVTDAGLAHLGRLTALRSLTVFGGDLFGKGITDRSTTILRNMPRLRFLELGGCLSDRGLRNLAQLSELEELYLESGSGDITDEGLKALEGLSGLKVLTVAFPQRVDRGKAWLRRALPGCDIW